MAGAAAPLPPNTPASLSQLEWDTDPADHCETPYRAYVHIAPILKRLAQRMGKTPATLCVWDPYFCLGTMKTHLARSEGLLRRT